MAKRMIKNSEKLIKHLIPIVRFLSQKGEITRETYFSIMEKLATDKPLTLILRINHPKEEYECFQITNLVEDTI